MKRKWMIIIGILLLMGGFANLTESLSSAFFGIIAGVALICMWIIKNKRARLKKNQYSYRRPNRQDLTNESDNAPEVENGKNIEVYRRHHHLVGVSFKNDDGSSRQKMLKKIAKENEKDDPEWFPNITIEQYDYQGSPAIGVYADDYQIGNISKDEVDDVLKNHDTIRSIDINVFGGDSGKSYGAEIVIIYNK